MKDKIENVVSELIKVYLQRNFDDFIKYPALYFDKIQTVNESLNLFIK